MAIMGIDAYVVLNSDPHLSEYLSEHWKFREWISGFSGSAGTVVVTADEAGLWTDSRYFLQAEEQLEESGITLFKMGEEEVPDYKLWLTEQLPQGAVVGVDGQSLSIKDAKAIKKAFKEHDLRLDLNARVQDEIWEGRPPLPDAPVFELDTAFAGLSRTEKVKQVQAQMRKEKVTHYIVCALDEIAWLLNMRGSDVEFNPVFHAFVVVSMNQVSLFIDPHKLTSGIGKNLTADDVKVFLYSDFYEFLRDMPPLSTILVDPQRVNSSVLSAVPSQAKIEEKLSIITKLKSVKNQTEIDGFKTAMLKDGVAMVKFLYWLDQNIGNTQITELSAAEKLRYFRAQQSDYRGDSFNTISAYGAHAALPHYSANEDSNETLVTKGLFLIDSGGQYASGTTDITRTIALGPVTNEEKKDFTLVLKGHIALAQARFPKGTRGVQLDILARHAMWQEGINYGHGTGHGIGHYLNVHEGPQSIRQQDNGIELKAGMITSNEPGIYRAGKHGIRTENLILTIEAETSEFGEFYQFETLTWCPIDTRVIDSALLCDSEKQWLNNYHKTVYELLNANLSKDEKSWLKEATKPI
jgi:Xaa-Pro aminopeptidase